MPLYQYTCDKCGAGHEVYAAITEDKTAPLCCGQETYHDFAKERFGGITNREKGTEYATGFLETFENRAAGRQEQVFIKSHQHHMQELAKRGLIQKGEQSPEAKYRRKHAQDRVEVQKRQQREEAGR